jgi:hypothetical protein
MEVPGVLLAGGEAEGDAGVEGQGTLFADEVVAAGVGALDGAVLDRIEHRQRRDDLAARVDTDLEPSPRERCHPPGDGGRRPEGDVQ